MLALLALLIGMAVTAIVMMVVMVVAQYVLGIPQDTKFGSMPNAVVKSFNGKIDAFLLEMYRSPDTGGVRMSALKSAMEAKDSKYAFVYKRLDSKIFWRNENGIGFEITLNNSFKSRMRLVLMNLSAMYLIWLTTRGSFEVPPTKK